jgi:hypothetical protein
MLRQALSVLLVAVAQTAWAQSPQVISPATAEEASETTGDQIAVDVRWLALNGSLTERAGVDLKLPDLGKHVIHDKQQTELILRMAHGDRRSNAGPLKTLVVPGREEREFSPFGRSRSLQGHDAIVAVADNDRQAIDVKLTWAKWKDGSERLPVTTAAVPMGSSLLICVTEQIASGPVKVSAWEQFLDRLLNRTRATQWREKQRAYVLLSPRIAAPEKQ